MHYKYITVEGNIGAGKTTLCNRLAETYNARLILEQFADNSFLPKFYKDPDRYAFQLEMSFLSERFKQLKQHLNTQDLFQAVTISDYLFIKCKLFAKVTLAEDEYHLFQTVFDIIYPNLPSPELLLFLHCPINKLQENIKKRARDYEQEIPSEYLQKIQDAYQSHLQNIEIPVLMMDSTLVNFFDDQDYKKITDLFEKKWEPGLHFIDFTQTN
jgi:deoxyguanosine kinase